MAYPFNKSWKGENDPDNALGPVGIVTNHTQLNKCELDRLTRNWMGVRHQHGQQPTFCHPQPAHGIVAAYARRPCREKVACCLSPLTGVWRSPSVSLNASGSFRLSLECLDLFFSSCGPAVIHDVASPRYVCWCNFTHRTNSLQLTKTLVVLVSSTKWPIFGAQTCNYPLGN